METIKITVSPKGESVVEACGFTGPACTEKTKQILEALGPKRDDQPKSEFFATPEQTQEISQ